MKIPMTKYVGLAIGILLTIANRAQGDMALVFSDVSSDETPASVLDARMTFSVVGSTLTLTVMNDTLADGTGFNINEIYFNATSDVAGLTLSPAVTGWDLYTVTNGTEADRRADGFGVFDFALIDGVGETNLHVVEPTKSRSFTFDITGSNLDDTDFTTEWSSIPPGDTPVLAALKFVSGPRDDSAWGGTTTVAPVPGAAVLGLVGLGLLGVGTRWMRRRLP